MFLRKFLHRGFILLFLTFVLSLSYCVVDVSSTNTNPIRDLPLVDPALKALLDDYQSFFEDGMATTQTPGAAVVIVKGNKVIFQKGFGIREVGTIDSVNEHTVLRIGSLSKGFAGILTGILVQKGVLDWEENVQNSFPEFALKDRQQAKRIKLWHLLSHTTGLPYHAYTNLIERGFSSRKIITDYFSKAPLSGKEGHQYSYQNVAFCAIEEVMKARAHKGYGQLLQENIFQPAGMLSASSDFLSLKNGANKALPHFWTGAYWRPDNISPYYYNAAAAGGVNASISDMGAWLQLLLGQKPELIDESTLEKVFTPIIKTGTERRTFPGWISRDDASYALGWRVLAHGDDTIIYHGGYVNGYRGEIAFNRKDNIGICILFNGSSAMCSSSIPGFFERWDKAREQIR